MPAASVQGASALAKVAEPGSASVIVTFRASDVPRLATVSFHVTGAPGITGVVIMVLLIERSALVRTVVVAVEALLAALISVTEPSFFTVAVLVRIVPGSVLASGAACSAR